MRLAALACVILMILTVFQAPGATAHAPTVPGSEYNYALASHGGVASASGTYQSNTPGRAIDGNKSTYWQSSTTTGWLKVAFPGVVSLSEVHAHFTSKVYASLSLLMDRNGDGDFGEAGENVWTTTTNANLVVVVTLAATTSAYAMELTINVANGKNKPAVSEFEAYLFPPDSDGDGLTDAEERRTVYFE